MEDFGFPPNFPDESTKVAVVEERKDASDGKYYEHYNNFNLMLLWSCFGIVS